MKYTATPVIGEINKTLCVIIEDNASDSRTMFLSELLHFNNYEVVIQQNENGTNTIGVTDLLFNPILDIYKRRLIATTGEKVTHIYWQREMNQ